MIKKITLLRLEVVQLIHLLRNEYELIISLHWRIVKNPQPHKHWQNYVLHLHLLSFKKRIYRHLIWRSSLLTSLLTFQSNKPDCYMTTVGNIIWERSFVISCFAYFGIDSWIAFILQAFIVYVIFKSAFLSFDSQDYVVISVCVVLYGGNW